MLKDLLGKYHQDIKVFLKKKKRKNDNMGVNDIKVSLKMKN